MDKQDEKNYEALFDMFGTNGWKLITEDIGNAVNALTSEIVSGSLTNELMREKIGEHRVFSYFMNYELAVRNSYDQAVNGESDHADL